MRRPLPKLISELDDFDQEVILFFAKSYNYLETARHFRVHAQTIKRIIVKHARARVIPKYMLPQDLAKLRPLRKKNKTDRQFSLPGGTRMRNSPRRPMNRQDWARARLSYARINSKMPKGKRTDSGTQHIAEGIGNGNWYYDHIT